MEILLVVLLLLLIFAALLMITCIVNFLIGELTVYHDIADMIMARKGVSCRIEHSGFYGDWLCCGHCKSLIEPDDPKPFRAKFKRSEEYGYVGELRPQFHVASDAVVMGQA